MALEKTEKNGQEISEELARKVLLDAENKKREDCSKEVQAALDKYGFSLGVINRLKGNLIENQIYLSKKV